MSDEPPAQAVAEVSPSNTSEKPRKALKTVDFDSHAALRVVKATILGTVGLHIGARMLGRHRITWRVAARFIFPVMCVREYFVVPVLQRSRWDTWRGVSIFQEERPALLYLVPESIISTELMGLATALNTSCLWPYFILPLGAQLGMNIARIAGWQAYHWSKSSATETPTSPGPQVPPQGDRPISAAAVPPVLQGGRSSGNGPVALSSHPSHDADSNPVDTLSREEPPQGQVWSKDPPSSSQATASPTHTIPPAEKAPPSTSQPSVWRRAWDGTRRVLHV